MSYTPPKKNVQHICYIALRDQSNTKLFKSNPTIASGDFKVSIDGGALSNLGTLPTVTPASSKMVKVTLSATEMNGDNITLVCSDAAGSEWCDLVINFQTAANQFDDLNTQTPLTAAQVNAEVDTALADYDPPTKAELDTAVSPLATSAEIAALNDPTAAAIADQVWEETLADHSGTSGSTAEALNNIPGAVQSGLEITWTIDDGTNPIDGVDTWITTDSGGTAVIWSGNTDSNGVALNGGIKPFLSAGTYYGWLAHAGYTATIPVTLAVS